MINKGWLKALIWYYSRKERLVRRVEKLLERNPDVSEEFLKRAILELKHRKLKNRDINKEN